MFMYVCVGVHVNSSCSEKILPEIRGGKGRKGSQGSKRLQERKAHTSPDTVHRYHHHSQCRGTEVTLALREGAEMNQADFNYVQIVIRQISLGAFLHT